MGNNNRINKLLLIFISLILLFNIISLYNNPATSYEPDIYKSLPDSFIPLTIIAMILLFIIFIYLPINKPTIILLILNYSIVLLIPLIKSYFLWNTNGDAGTHLGSIFFIINEGYFDSSDIYPYSKIFIAVFNIILKMDVSLAIKLIPFIIAVSSLPFYYFISRYICPDKNYQKIVILLSCCFIGDMFITFSPNHLAYLFFPVSIFIMLFYYKNIKFEHFIILLIIIIILPISHIILSITFIILLISFFTIKNKENYRMNRMVILTTVITITWISTFYIWLQMLKKIVTLFDDSTKTSAGAIINQIDYANQFNIDLISYIFYAYGISIILILSFIIILFLSKRIKNVIINRLNIFYILISILIIIQLFMFTGFSPLRFLVFLNIIGIFYLGLLLYRLNIKSKIRYTKAFSLLIVIIIFITGLLTVYPSSTILLSNYQTTSAELDGAKWYYNYYDSSYNITGISLAPGRYSAFILDDGDPQKENIPLYFDIYNTCPYHFNYNDSNSIYPSYILLTVKDRALYTEIYPSMADVRWNDNDFEKLSFFNNINRVYSNSDMECWIIMDDE